MSIHSIYDLDKISITESQNKLSIINPKEPRNALVYTRRTVDINLLKIIKTAIETYPALANKKINLLKNLLDSGKLDDAAIFDLKKLDYFCGSNQISTLFDLGFLPEKDQQKTNDLIKQYIPLLSGYMQDYKEIQIGNIIIQPETATNRKK
jgi:hypothetical protein